MSSERVLLLAGVLLAGLSVLCTPVVAQSPQTSDPLGVVVIRKDAPVAIGGMWVLSGADTALGLDSRRGAEIAFREVGNRILGHAIHFIVQDDQCTAEGGQIAATRLAATPNIVGVLGSACSSVCVPAAPILWAAGIVEIGNACTAPSLTAPDRKPGYEGFARTVYSDTDQGAADADYLYTGLRARRIVTVHDGSPYAQQLTLVAAASFSRLGGTVLAQEAVAPLDVDMHPLLARIAAAQPDAIYLPVFLAAGAQIVRQAKGMPGLDGTVLVGGGGLLAPELLSAAGPSALGLRVAAQNISPEVMGGGYPAFVQQYRQAYGEAPIAAFHAQAHDAASLLMQAIAKVAVTDAQGTTYIGRKALRDAVFSIRFDGVSGEIACDPHGGCSAFKPAVYQYVSTDPATYAIGINPRKIYP